MPTVHGVSASPYVRKVLIALAEKNLPFDHDPVIPTTKSPALLAQSPLGKVPYYTDGELAIADSSVICAYLEKTHPTPALYPAAPADYARALWLEEYGDTRGTEAFGIVFFERVLAPVIMGRPTDEARVADLLLSLVPQTCEYLESQLEEGRDWFVGGDFSIADITIGAQLVNLAYAREKVDETRFPKLAAFAGRFMQRPSVAAAMAMDKQALPGG